MIGEARLRSGRAGSPCAAASQIKAAITTTRKCGATTILVRGDLAFGTKKVITTCLADGVEFSLSVSRNKRLTAAIEAIDEAAYTPVHYPGAVTDPDTGALISDAEVAETPYPLRLGRGRTIIVRLVVRRIKDARYRDGLFPVWRYHPFVTNSDLSTTEADLTHRRHAIIETTFADLIDGPLAHIPSRLQMSATRRPDAQDGPRTGKRIERTSKPGVIEYVQSIALPVTVLAQPVSEAALGAVAQFDAEIAGAMPAATGEDDDLWLPPPQPAAAAIISRSVPARDPASGAPAACR